MRKTIVYAVFKQAVYRHECCGIFRTQEAAEACARAVVEREDGHHGTEVVPFVLDQAGAAEGEPGGWPKVEVVEPSAVVRFHKNKYRPGGAVIRTEVT
jgi:hypothetical protein